MSGPGLQPRLHLRACAALIIALGALACGDDGGSGSNDGHAQAGALAATGAGTSGGPGSGQAGESGAGTGGSAAGAGPNATADAGMDAAVRDAAIAPPPDLRRSCRNRLRDGNETDIDCGGGECGTCLSGRHCERGEDCLSGECVDNACTCAPLRECPAGACGTVRHCGGELACGECAEGVCYENRCCSPRTCAKDECGVFPDGCGGTVRCGDASCCTPRSCEHASLANRCGEFDDRCGGTVTCSCADDEASCYLGECCKPRSCDETAQCGATVSDGCGGTIRCDCPDGQTCYQGECCEPMDCSDFQGPGCASLPDGCGGTIACGCDEGERCYENSCCTPITCGAGAAGDVCGVVSDSCGATISCSCNGLPCIAGHCCQAQSCSEQERDQRCGPATDGCGVSLWCGCGTNTAIRVAQRAACGDACADTLGALRDCTANAALETLEQTAGWNFGASLSSSLCSAGYGFSPSWTMCHSGFQLDAQGFVYLAAGTHCFSITGNGSNSCGSLYFVSEPDEFSGWDALPDDTEAAAVTGGPAACFTLNSADYYPIRWHYTQDAALQDFHVNYCAGGPTGCVPLPSSMLRPALP